MNCPACSPTFRRRRRGPAIGPAGRGHPQTAQQLTGSGRPYGMRPAGRGRPPVAFAVVGVLLVLAVFFGVSALLFGLFPFPLLWIGLLVFLIARGAARRRRWAQQGGYSNSARLGAERPIRGLPGLVRTRRMRKPSSLTLVPRAGEPYVIRSAITFLFCRRRYSSHCVTNRGLACMCTAS